MATLSFPVSFCEKPNISICNLFKWDRGSSSAHTWFSYCLKVYIWPKCFFRFSLSLRHLNMSSNSKKWIPMLFAIKSSFKFPALATPNEVDRVMIDWWRMTSLQGYLEALCFSFACLTTALLGWLPFVGFLSRETPFHYWNNSYLN